ncbi:MAG: nuclease-related domain-containing protein [Promethearchaeota archaeon]
MARIIGGSGSTDYLRNKLRKVKLEGLNTFEDIKSFKVNFPQLVHEKKEEEKKILTNEIDTLKSSANSLNLKLKESIELRKSELQVKKEALITQISSNESVKSANRQLKKLETKFDKIVEKPFKKDKKQISKIKKSYQSIEKKFDKTIEKKVVPLHKANKKIEENFSFLQGAEGEEYVIRELSKLPDTYYVFNEYQFKLPKSVYSKSTQSYVRSCKIDHLVVGPTGIFIIETKNWSAQRLLNASFTPHQQVDNAGLVFYIFMSRKFRRRKFPNYKVVVMLGNVPKINYPYVTQLSLFELNRYILNRTGIIITEDINKLVKWLYH